MHVYFKGYDFDFIFLIFHISNLRMHELKMKKKNLSEHHLTNVYSALQVEVSTMFYLGDLCSMYKCSMLNKLKFVNKELQCLTMYWKRQIKMYVSHQDAHLHLFN